MAEHLATDDLKGFHGLCLFLKLLLVAVDALQLVFYTLFRFYQLTGDSGVTMIIDQSLQPVSAVRQEFVVQIIIQFLVQQSHRDLCGAVIVLGVKSRP